MKTTVQGWVSALNILPIAGLAVGVLGVIAANLAVFGVGQAYQVNTLSAYERFLVDKIPSAENQDAHESAVELFVLRDASARLTWSVMITFESISFVAAIVYFVWCIAEQTRGLPFRRAAICLLAVIVAALGLGLLWLDESGRFPELLSTSGYFYAGKLIELAWKLRRVEWLKYVVAAHNALAIGIVLLGTIAVSVTAGDPVTGVTESPEWLSTRIAKMRKLLSVAAVVLAIGVVQMSTHFRWPAALVRDKIALTKSGDGPTLPVAETFSSFASSATFAAGSAFTLFLICVFGPGFFVLDSKAQQLAEKNGHGDLGEWRRRNKLTVSWEELYTDLTKIVGPIAVAIIASLIKF